MELESYINRNKSSHELVKINGLIFDTYKNVWIISHNFAIPDLMKGDFKENLRSMLNNMPGKNGLHVQLSTYQDIKWDNLAFT